MKRDIVTYGVKKFAKVFPYKHKAEADFCKKCCFHIMMGDEVLCNSPCDVRFWGCEEGKYFYWKKK